MSRKRRLTEEDLALWRRVADSADALRDRQTFDPTQAYDAPASPPRKKTPPQPADRDGQHPPVPAPAPRPRTSFELAPSLPDSLRRAPVQMDRKTFGRMSRGKLKPEGRIDLHGMTLDRAHGALTRYLLGAHGAGKRLVLVITGKGRDRDEGGPIPVRQGVLRHQVPQWLSMPPLSGVVLQITPAHIRHGGGGAYYVYLRRRG